MIFGKNILKDFCKLCNISYLPGQDVIESFYCRPFNTNDNCSVFYNCDKPPILYSRGRDSQMYVCKYDNKLSITFRGTESARDILTDLNCIQIQMPLKNMKEDKLPQVHWGFYNQFSELKPEMDKIIKDYFEDYNPEIDNLKEIIFSGHSLGGALATVSALNYSYEYPDAEIDCVTFGSPRVGDIKFAEYFDERIDNSYRFVNDNDPIPCIPTAWRYKHVKGCVWLYEDQVMNEITVWRGWRFIKNYILSFFGYGYDASKDHSCDGYVKDLEYLKD